MSYPCTLEEATLPLALTKQVLPLEHLSTQLLHLLACIQPYPPAQGTCLGVASAQDDLRYHCPHALLPGAGLG